MSFYSKIVDYLNAAARTKDAAKVALVARDAVRVTVKFLFEKKGELVPGGGTVQGGGVRGAPALPRGGTVLGLVQKDGRMVLDDTPLVDFKVDPARAVGVGSNLVVRTTMKFGYAYANEYPEIPAGKAGRPAIRYRFGESAAFGPVEVVAEGRLRSVGFAGAGEVGELSVSE